MFYKIKMYYIGSDIKIFYMGAGAPAKTKNDKRAYRLYIFREKVRPFPHLARTVTALKEQREGLGEIYQRRLLKKDSKLQSG
jgi:hypothetical protein